MGPWEVTQAPPCLKARLAVFLKAWGIRKATRFPGTFSGVPPSILGSVHLTEIWVFRYWNLRSFSVQQKACTIPQRYTGAAVFGKPFLIKYDLSPPCQLAGRKAFFRAWFPQSPQSCLNTSRSWAFPSEAARKVTGCAAACWYTSQQSGGFTREEGKNSLKMPWAQKVSAMFLWKAELVEKHPDNDKRVW